MLTTSATKTRSLRVAGQPVTAKVAYNWKLVQISGENRVAICCYDANGERAEMSTPVKKIIRSEALKGCAAQTDSGSFWVLEDATTHQSLWKMGLQIKRPELYERLKEIGVL